MDGTHPAAARLPGDVDDVDCGLTEVARRTIESRAPNPEPRAPSPKSCAILPVADLSVERSAVRWFTARVSWLLTGVCALMGLIFIARPAMPQFTSFSHNSRSIVEGNWQSCREADGRYSERVYDHVINHEGRFELHMGPRREFALFKG